MNEACNELWQRERIRDLLARYCQCLDEYDIEGVAACFTHDAVTDYGAGRGGPVQGRDSIAERIGRGQARFLRTHHQLGQIRVDLQGESAKATSYQMTFHELESGKIDLVCLRYLDELVMVEGQWLIAHRRVEVTLVDGFEGVEWSWVQRREPSAGT
jgi:hypothetical protein